MSRFARALLAAALAAGAIAVTAGAAGAATVSRPLPASDYTVKPLCGEPGQGEAACFALKLVPRTAAARERATPIGMTVYREVEPQSAASGPYGLRPQDLHSGYGLPTESPSSQTIAIVDAYDDPTAEADLATYDAEFGLPGCTTANGCFTKVNQEGNASPLPAANSGWAGEIALDVETAHAVCQNCKILLVEGNNAYNTSLEAAENTAARLGATEISNSFGGPSEPSVEGSAYNHPGIAITVSTGDHGYLDWDNSLNPGFVGHPEYPASSPHVVAVGGTRLALVGGAWSSERAWNDGSSTGFSEGAGGSACSEHLSAQPWQTSLSEAVGCTAGRRATADVAADADPFTGVAIYQGGEWSTAGGTSLASPIVASVFALAGGSGGVSYPAQTLYGNLGSAGLHDITVGSNGECAKEFDFGNLTAGCTTEEEEAKCGGALICKAASGYDGPTGVGTPSGLTAFAPPPAVSGVSPDEGDLGAVVTIGGERLAGATSVKFGGAPATDLEEVSSTELKATAPGGTGEVDVTVTNGSGTSATSASDRFTYLPNPAIASIEPPKGTLTGGTAVTIRGERLDNVEGVEFDGNPATALHEVSSTELTATTPAHAEGEVDVTVQTSHGASATTSFDRFSYVDAPVNGTPPVVSGSAVEGQTLTTTSGSWTPNPTSFSYKWLRCDSSGANCAAIGGATEAAYDLSASDVGHTLKVEVTAQNTGGEGSATSAATAVVVPLPPTNTSPPTISGAATEGQTLTAVNGTWTHSPTSYDYQWLSCDSSGTNCTAIASADTQTYELTAADVSHKLKIEVTAHNAGGEGSATSSATAVVEPMPPTNTSLPAISGTATEGQTLSATNGTWTHSPTSFIYRWLRCDSSGANCSAIGSATSQTHELTTADVGHKLKVEITAHNAGGEGLATSLASEVVVPLPPANTSLPTISGTATEGQTLTATNGSWTHSPTSYTYKWLRCDSTGANCSAIGSATSQTYKLVSTDVGHKLKAEVAAHNAGGEGSATSAASEVVLPLPPTNTSLPTIGGSTVEGQTLTGANGTWSRSPTSFDYQWLRCDSTGANCAAIGSATSQIYELIPADVGHMLKIEVTARNAGGEGSATSAASALVTELALVPVNTALPEIEGQPVVERTLTAKHGAWENGPTSYAYQWLRCAGSCSPISGATGQTYVLTTEDAFYAIRVEVTAENAKGSGSARSEPTATIEYAAPVDLTKPTIEGAAVENQILTASHGDWENNPFTHGYQWLRCDSEGHACTAISGGTGASILTTSADVGHTLEVEVTAYTSGGTATATSDPTAVVEPPAPTNSIAPTISGTATEGQTLTAANGTWTHSPTSFTYKWLRCDSSGASCSAISGAVAQTFELTAADVSHRLKVEVTAHNAGGEGSATSAASALVTAPVLVPVNTALPEIEGQPDVEHILTAKHGSWENGPTSYAYQWLRCAGSCSPISGATGQTYVLTTEDAFYTIRVEVTAENAVGSASARSAPTATIEYAAPVDLTKPTIEGAAVENQILTASHGNWENSPYLYTYQWLRCDSTGANCAAVSGKTSASFVTTSADVGNTLEVEVTAHASGGTATATSDPTAVIEPPTPTNSVAPTISGSTVEGQTLTAANGAWTHSPTSFTYKWLRCDSTSANCSAIGSATAQTYELTAADVGHKLKVEVTAHNAGGEGSATSVASALVTALVPVNTVLPEIEGQPVVERTLTAKHGAWDNGPTSYSYQWLRCFVGGGSCSPIAGATGQTYTLATEDAFYAIRVEVTAENAVGSAFARSEPTATIEYAAPVDLTKPTIEGVAVENQILTANHGTWENNPYLYAYQWLRCDSTGANCSAIGSATVQAYELAAADVGHELEVEVTAHNAGGQASADSSPSAVVAARPSEGEETPEEGSEEAPGGDGEGGDGGSTGGGGGSDEHVVPPPTAGTAVAGPEAMVKHGKATVTLSCTGGGPCRGTLLLQVAPKGKTHRKRHPMRGRVHRKGAQTIGRASFSIPAGGHTTVSVHLTGKGKALVGKAGKKGLMAQLAGTGIASRRLKLQAKG